MKVSYWIERLQGMNPDEHVAISLWSTSDVIDCAKEDDYNEPTQEEVNYILDDIDVNWDADYGISWENIKNSLYDLEEDKKIGKRRNAKYD
jgi:hypothetical protein